MYENLLFGEIFIYNAGHREQGG